MRILHIRNVVNVANVLATKQRELGHEAVTLGILNKPQAYRSEFNVGLEIEYPFSDVPKRFFRIITNLSKHMDFDVFHLHDGGLLPRDIDVPLWFKVMGKVCVHWHGSKLRNRGNPGLSKCADNVFVSTPDLLEFEKRAEWIPNPIDLQALPKTTKDKERKEGSLRVLHAPTDRKVKGTDGIISKINELRKDGLNIELQIKENSSYQQVLEAIAQADIIIDWINPKYGIYGMVSIEGMALGKPVICSINEEYLNNFYHGCPIINADFNNLNEKVRYLLEDESARRAIGKKGRVYVERMHDAVTIIKKVLAFYD